MKPLFLLPIVLVILGGFTLFFLYADKAVFHSPLNDSVNLTGETKEFEIEAFQFGYEPSVIEVNHGDVVKIIARSRDVEHGLMISDFDVNMKLNKEPQKVEFIADKKGTFSFYCHVPCGKGHGAMRGTLVVN